MGPTNYHFRPQVRHCPLGKVEISSLSQPAIVDVVTTSCGWVSLFPLSFSLLLRLCVVSLAASAHVYIV